MSTTLNLVEQIFQSSPTTLTPSLVEWHSHNDEWSLRIEAHAPGVYRLRWGPLSWLEPSKPNLRLQQQAEMLLARQEAVGEMQTDQLQPSGWSFEQGEFSLQLGRKECCLSLFQGDKCVARADFTSIPAAPNSTDSTWQLVWSLAADEQLYGLGEALDTLTRNAVLVQDNPDDRVLPLAWSPNGWGTYVNTLEHISYDTSNPGKYTIQTGAKGFDLFIFAGNPEEVLNQYTSLTGRAGQPELWSMGVWLDQGPDQSLEQSLEQVKKLRQQNIALDTLSLANPAVLGFQADKAVFEWPERIADWRKLSTQLEELNLHIAGGTFPGVLQGTELFDEWEDRGWLLVNEEGDPWVCPGMPASGGKPFGLLDLTHKDALRLWSECHQKAVEEGFHAPICAAQFAFPDDIDARGRQKPDVLRVIYPHLARQALFNAVAAWRTPQEGVMPSRDLFPGVQRFAWQQGPDVPNNWQGMAQSLTAALTIGNSGVAVQTHKLGNSLEATTEMTPELYLRWLAMAVFSANFSFQGKAGLMPDAFDTATQKLVAHWLEWRYRLLPYIAGIIDDAVRTGLPVQRSMAQVFPNDSHAHKWEHQYMLGPALLVAPVMQPGNQVEVYLPEGDAWWDLSTGWRYEGGTHWKMEVGLDAIPVFGREGHMLCIGPATQHTGEINSARILEEVWLFGMPEHNPVVMRNKIRVMQMQGSSYIKGLEGLKILPSEGLEVKRRGAEVRISRAR